MLIEFTEKACQVLFVLFWTLIVCTDLLRSYGKTTHHIEKDMVLDVITHPNPSKYPNQKMFVVNIDNYAYLVPFVEDDVEIFLKTIMPSRKATKKYLEVKND